jgi:chromosome partitioning protein
MEGLSVATADLDPQRTLTRWHRRRPKDMPRAQHYEVSWDDASALTEVDGIDPCDLLLIDTPPSHEARPSEFARLIRGCDLILVPSRASMEDAESAAPFLRMLREQGRKALAVLTFVKPRVNVNATKQLLIREGALSPFEIFDRTDYSRAAERGLSVLDLGDHLGGKEVGGLWEQVKAELWGRSGKRDEAA